MRIDVPTGARLQNIEAFAKHVSESEDPSLHLTFPTTYFALHPMVIAAIAAAGLRAQAKGASITCDSVPETPSVRYLERMGLFGLLNLESGAKVTPREEAGRFVPLRVIRDGRELSDFVVQLVPLFHTEPDRAAPMQYAISELVRNTLEHSGQSPTAVVAAQVYPKSGIIAIGVADCGIGIRHGLAPSYETDSDLAAIQLALQPGITGTTRRAGGTADNAGAGLYFCKAMALSSRNYFVLHSGNGLFKLRVREKSDDGRFIIFHDPAFDRATRHDSLPGWPGTLVGLDISIDTYQEFSAVLQYIRETYDLDVRNKRKARHKAKAKFS